MKQKIKKVVGTIFILLAIVFLLIALFFFLQYQKGNQDYEEITNGYTEVDEDDRFYLDWDALYAMNNDLVGWIRMAPTVDYPIVQGDDNSYYLHHGFDKNYNINGCIMMNCYNSSDWSDKNTVVYGHNMRNGSMFGNNDYYHDKSYAEENPYFYIYVEDGGFAYRIFAVMTVPDDSRPFTISFDSDEEFGEYLTYIDSIKDYDLGVDVEETDQIVTLSTCNATGTQRFLIQGKLESFTDWDGNTITVDELEALEAEQEASGESAEETVEETAEETANEASE